VLRLYADERPRAVIVGWDTLEAPTKRHEMFPAYQSGREFDDDLIEQLNVLPELVAAFGFANAKAPGYEADDFLAADAKAPLPSLADQEPTWGSASTFARDWGLNQLADRLDRMA
jgi:DNA polymerase I